MITIRPFQDSDATPVGKLGEIGRVTPLRALIGDKLRDLAGSEGAGRRDEIIPIGPQRLISGNVREMFGAEAGRFVHQVRNHHIRDHFLRHIKRQQHVIGPDVEHVYAPTLFSGNILYPRRQIGR